MKITDKAMQSTPTAVHQWLVEPFGRGHGALVGRITPAGSRSFYYRYSGTAGQVRLPIGPYSARGDGSKGFTVAQARSQAMQWATLYTNGIKDVREHLEQQEALRQRRQEAELAQLEAEREAAELEQQHRISIRALAERWRDIELRSRNLASGERAGRKDSGALALAQFERHVFPLIGDMTAPEVTKADVMRVLDAQTTRGKQRTAQMLFADLNQMFHFALDRDLVPANPMATLKKVRVVGSSTERERILSIDEIQNLARALPLTRMSPRSVCAIWLILATGCRIGELMGATWVGHHEPAKDLEAAAEACGVKFGQVDMAHRIWEISSTKNGRTHRIHLSEFALSQFAILRDLRESCAWIFPDRAGTGPVCVKSFSKQLSDRQRTPDERMSHRSQDVGALLLPGGRWTAHDLRRTAASLMAQLGISGDTVDECLNHVVESKVRRVYIRDRREADQARAFDALGARLTEVIGPPGPAATQHTRSIDPVTSR